MKRKPKRRSQWKKYEAEKKALAARGLPPAAYEKAIQALAKKYRL